jgi:DNA-binding response OmpR family regulator
MAATDTPPLVLVTEDDAITGLSIQDILTEAGYRVAGPLGSEAGALTWMERETPDLAVIGALPKDGADSALAGILRRRGVPFLVHSCAAQDAARISLRGAPWLSKPAWPWDVVATLDDLSLLATGRSHHSQTSGPVTTSNP